MPNEEKAQTGNRRRVISNRKIIRCQKPGKKFTLKSDTIEDATRPI